MPDENKKTKKTRVMFCWNDTMHNLENSINTVMDGIESLNEGGKVLNVEVHNGHGFFPSWAVITYEVSGKK